MIHVEFDVGVGGIILLIAVGLLLVVTMLVVWYEFIGRFARREIIAVLRRNKNRPMTARELARATSVLTTNPLTIGLHLTRLERDRQIVGEDLPGPVGNRVYRIRDN